MVAQTSILYVRVDDKLKADATEKLANLGLTISDAVHIPLTYIVKDDVLPADPETYGTWFHAKIQEAFDDTRQPVPHQQVMDEAQELIERKFCACS
ncbi:type II toxin-antitoxin system RelB/DinJ family antitoxin [Photorhabdus namnaonensis]|uniref:Antitoxin DinJ n=1 Tax=Photorhabdus namnaonensis TaxID=1851568 RepID=A0A1B8YI86_9GAMM|nr:type II toxin-antitoxin system RelB/DinJ family antitoxin [Photorhabdus namnaonensis]OCA54817.1 Antitoxin DinJ [Photorhabdus namnaonensis]